MIAVSQSSPVGLLFSGGLDSAILLGHLVRGGHHVQPFYIRSNLVWQAAEFDAARQFVQAIAGAENGNGNHGKDGRVEEIVALDLPLDDLYGEHWSVTGHDTPGAETDDAAVFLPGRNPLLVIKAALWCALNGIEQLALAPLAANPFADAGEAFFTAYETALNRATDGHESCGPVRLLRPFSQLSKRSVMELGRGLPLDLTFSCIRPADDLHCGKCNKCAERQTAFHAAGLRDQTRYALAAGSDTV